MSRADHCVLQTGGLLCARCQERYAVAWPISARMLAAISRAFVQEHRGCKPDRLHEDTAIDFEMRLSEAYHERQELETKLLALEKAACTCDTTAHGHYDECPWLVLMRKAGLT